MSSRVAKSTSSGTRRAGSSIDIFLSKYYDAADPTLPPLGNVITLSSPHEGAPLATAAGQIRTKTSGRVILDDLVGDHVGVLPPANSTAVGQLAEGSPTIKSLFPRGLPEHIDFTTIGADTDYVVPATNISVPGATETVIPGATRDLLNEHSAIVTDADALRAVRSALEGRPPPCISIDQALRGAVVPVIISRFEHTVGEVGQAEAARRRRCLGRTQALKGNGGGRYTARRPGLRLGSRTPAIRGHPVQAPQVHASGAGGRRNNRGADRRSATARLADGGCTNERTTVAETNAPVVTMKQLLEAGVHFGHQTRRWNPKMKRFIFGERNGIYIIDLQQTLERIDTAYRFVRSTVEDGGTVLFVGTKKQAQEPIQKQADRAELART